MKKTVPFILLCVYLIVFTICAISPSDRSVWWTENLPIMLIVLALAVIYRFYVFSPSSYVLMSCLVILHTIGGHYTFEKVPFGFVTDLFGFSRNHYDRVAHFSVGFYAYPIAELLLIKRLVSSRWVLFLFPIFTVLAVAGAYEIFEWLYAISADPSAGSAVLGSQGDVWDAQKDMLADGLGAVFSMALFALVFRKNIAATGRSEQAAKDTELAC
jgi:putative membrane protein